MTLSHSSQNAISSWADEVKASDLNHQEQDDEEILRAAAGEIDMFRDYTDITELAKTIQKRIDQEPDTTAEEPLARHRTDSSDTAEIEKELKQKQSHLQKLELPPLHEKPQKSDLKNKPSVESLSDDGVSRKPESIRDDKQSYASHRETADLRERLESLEEMIHQLQVGRERDITHRKNIQIQVNQILREMKSFDANLLKINGTINASLTKFLSQVHSSLEAVSSGSHTKKINDQIDASYADLTAHIKDPVMATSASRAFAKSDLIDKLSRIKKLNKQ